MNPFNLFNKIYCINIDQRTDRWKQAQDEFKRLDIGVERFPATTGDNKFVAFNTSQLNCIKAAHDYFNVLILEDDIAFAETSNLEAAVNELPEDWDCLYLGGNIIGCDTIPFKPPFRFSDHLFCLIDCWQTQSVAYSQKGMQFVIDNFKVDNGYNYDEWLRNNMLPRRKSFIVAPQMTYQRPSYSDIWQCNADFSHLLEAGNKLLI